MAADDEGGGVPEWVVTYGDMMSLLLTFFIMLVSLSEIRHDDGATRLMLNAIRQAFGATAGRTSVPGRSPQISSIKDQLSSRGRRSEGATERSGRDAAGRSGPHTPVRRMNHGTRITLGGPARFERFDATLSEALRRNLEVLLRVVGPKSNQIVIRGHASPEPLPEDLELEFGGVPIRDPFDLSFARARAVAEYLVDRGIDRHRVRISAAGDTEPRTLTREKPDQKYNRRVDVFLIDSYTTPSE